MSLKLENLFSEADAIIEKKASSKQAFQPSADVAELAKFLMSDAEKVAEVKKVEEQTTIEKLAYSLCLIEALNNAEKLTKMAQFEKKAMAQGHSADEINSYLARMI